MRYFGVITIIIAVFGGLFLTSEVEAVDEMKTLSYFVGQETGAVSSASWPFSFYIGDQVVSAKSAFFEISGISPAAPSLSINLNLGGGSGACALSRTLDTSGVSNEFRILYDVTSCINVSSKGDYSRTLNITTGSAVDALSARFFITYRFTALSNSGSTAMKTARFAANEGTATADVTPGNSTTFNFNIFVGDNLTAVKNAFFEVSGISAASAASTLNLSLGGGSGPCALSRTLDTTGRNNELRILYDVTSCINITARGSYSRSVTVGVTSGGANVSIFSPKLFLTYQFTPPASGGYFPTGIFYSPIFDTGAVNGASYNWIMWKGVLNSGKIKIQLATSNCSNGATDPPTCVTGSWGATGSNYTGPDCAPSSYFEQTASGISNEIGCPAIHHNKRYFRYKKTLCSASDCSSPGANTPQVDDVIVNWSP